MKKFSSFDDEVRDRMLPTARHEFGHYAVARQVGFATHSVRLTSGSSFMGHGGGAELSMTIPIFDMSSMRNYCENRIRVLSAGVLAEAMEGGQVDNEFAISLIKSSGSDDYSKTRELLRILRNIDHPHTTDSGAAQKELNDIYDRIWGDTLEIVKHFASFIEPMAAELVNKASDPIDPMMFTENELALHPLVQEFFR